MSLRCKDVENLAACARIELQEEEIIELTAYLNNTLNDVLVPMREYNFEGVEPQFNLIDGLANVLRDDVSEFGFGVEAALSNAGQAQMRFFSVPAILADGGEA